ncbi:hypothetical protein [Arthrobacter sp. 24S4-2]|uniref:hypothetical protein n=1 Tax=Arthrobacter sp. 24S4-2 TaxID=2575374 RepID=UPI0015860EF4|nr:hypothetical protein [Arthrobacter sp. 24S4-2]
MNLYAASVLDWAERGITVRLETAFPHTGVATLQITAAVPTEARLPTNVWGMSRPGRFSPWPERRWWPHLIR